MQSIFAYHTAKVAEYNIRKKDAQEFFVPDLDSMEEQDKELLSEQYKQTGEAWDQSFSDGFDSLDKDINKDILEQIKNQTTNFKNSLIANKEHFKKRLIADLGGIYDDYVKLVVLMIELQEVIRQHKQKRNIEHDNFAKNVIVNALKNFETLENEKVRKNISWDTDLVKSWFKEHINTDETFQEYDNQSRADFEDDKSILQYILKSIIFKNESIEDYFESQDIGWAENKAILKSMVLKTIKSVESDDLQPALMELSKNWEEDLDFLKVIYDLTIENEDDYEDMIKKWSKNWEIDRVALTDRIILEMALAEMINFPSIPVKVSINEYIELSKQYSTPKSKQFVNGLLDVLSEELIKEGQIKKSGRGLLDNK